MRLRFHVPSLNTNYVIILIVVFKKEFKVKINIEKNTPTLMIVPVIIMMLIVTIAPLTYVFGISLTDSTIAKFFQNFIGFANYKQAFNDSIFKQSIFNTLWFAFAVSTVETFLGFILAYIVIKIESKRIAILLSTLSLLPLFTPPVATAMIWRLIYDPSSGLINHYMYKWGIFQRVIAFLGENNLAMPSIMFTDIWQWTPFCFLLSLSVFQLLPKEPYEAADVDGASPWQVFRRLTLPMVLPNMIIIFLFKFLIALKVFDLVYMLTYGGPGIRTQVTSFYIYRVVFKMFNTGYGGALSIIVLLTISVVAMLITTVHKKTLKGE